MNATNQTIFAHMTASFSLASLVTLQLIINRQQVSVISSWTQPNAALTPDQYETMRTGGSLK
jgi:hypothetical protein